MTKQQRKPAMIGLDLSRVLSEPAVMSISPDALHRTLREITRQLLGQMSAREIEEQKPREFTREEFLKIWNAERAVQGATFMQYEVCRTLHRATVVPCIDRRNGVIRIFAALGLYYNFSREAEGQNVDEVIFYRQEERGYLCEMPLVDHATNEGGDILLLVSDSGDVVHPRHCGIIPKGSVGWPAILCDEDAAYDWLARVNWLLWERDENPLTALLRSRVHQHLARQVVEILEALRDEIITNYLSIHERQANDCDVIMKLGTALLENDISPLVALTNERPRTLCTTAADQVFKHIEDLLALVHFERDGKPDTL